MAGNEAAILDTSSGAKDRDNANRFRLYNDRELLMAALRLCAPAESAA